MLRFPEIETSWRLPLSVAHAGHVPTAGLAALSGHSHRDTGGLTNERLPMLSGSRRTTLSKHAGQWRPEPGRRKDDEASGWGSGASEGADACQSGSFRALCHGVTC